MLVSRIGLVIALFLTIYKKYPFVFPRFRTSLSEGTKREHLKADTSEPIRTQTNEKRKYLIDFLDVFTVANV